MTFSLVFAFEVKMNPDGELSGLEQLNRKYLSRKKCISHSAVNYKSIPRKIPPMRN
jgi:hypothetical protein